MTVVRTFVLREPRHAAELVAFLKEHAGKAVSAGRPLQVVVSERRRKRSTEANARYWAAVLTPVSRQVCLNGRWFDPETWHVHFSREHLPEKTASGKDKWTYLPDGERVLAIGTSDLNTDEFHDYVQRVEADAAMNYDVTFDDNQERN